MTDLFARCGFPSVARVLCLAAACFSGAAAEGDTGIALSVESGLNYETLAVLPSVTEPPAGSTLTIVVRDAEKAPVVEEGLATGTVQKNYEKRTAGRAIAVDGYIVSEGGAVTNASAHELLMMARVHDTDDSSIGNWDDKWMHEDAETFTNETGTGTWEGTNLVTVTNGLLAIDTKAEECATQCVTCTVGPVPTPRRGFTFATDATFSEPTSDPPDPEGQKLGITVACLDDDNPNVANFIYVENGAWTAVPVETCDPLVSSNWQIRVAVDADSSKATYYARPDGAGPWVILGTATQDGLGEVTEATFYGRGSVTGIDGNGFDTQLIQAQVFLDDRTLYPGCDFEETVVTGRVVASVVHSTDRTGGTYTIRLTDVDGNVVETKDYAFNALGEMEFYVKGSDLTAGSGYTVDVILDTEGESNPADVTDSAIMGRSLTNSTWGVTGAWIYEDAHTFAGEKPGTGDWTDDYSCATQSGDWIVVKTVSDETDLPLEAKVTFAPTNSLDKPSSYEVGLSVVFPESTGEPDPATGVFGYTLATSDDDVLQLMCLSNGAWQAVSTDVFAPELNVEYRLVAFVEMGQQRIHYYLDAGDGGRILLMGFQLDETYARLFTRMDLQGCGSVTDLAGDAYSTELLRLDVDFDDDTMYPGTNFEATAANGVVHFTRLWETSHTNGDLYVTVKDKWGSIVGRRRISFHDLHDRDFEYLVKDLIPGESYTVEVTAEVKGIVTDAPADDFREGVMARSVTNELWTTDGWIRENAATFAGEATGSGVWYPGEGLAVATNDVISIDTTLDEDTESFVGYAVTNALPAEHTGYEIRTRIQFDLGCVDLPEAEGSYGAAMVLADLETVESDERYRLAIVTNGVWTLIDPEVFEPELGREYDLTVRVDGKRHEATYLIAYPGEKPQVISCFDTDEAYETEPSGAEYRGVGHVEKLEGDGNDTALIRTSVDFDETKLTPGTNFEATVVAGRLTIRKFWDTDKNSGEYTVNVYDGRGGLAFTRTLTYSELKDQDFAIDVTNLVAGGVYDITVEATLDGESVGTDYTLTKLARALGTWIDEDATTFAGEREGTGLWSGTNETTSVVGEGEDRAIQISTVDETENVVYQPTNDTLSVRCSTLREIRMNLTFESAGWYGSEAAPSVPSNALAAVTVWCDDTQDVPEDELYALAVLSSTNGDWSVVEETKGLFNATNPCGVTVLIDYRTGFVRYTLETGSYSNRVFQYDFEPCHSETNALKFRGTGKIASIDGETWDPNLIMSATNEFATLDEAILGSNPDETLSPLWWADQLVTVGRGSFRIYDPDDWLKVSFPWWYYVVITDDGDVKVYTFNWSNNWIDYAEGGDANVETNGSVYIVHTPEGLSWIAAQATNEWISGRIELAADIDLTIHNWTPIAGFTGTFDGLGRTITGLNNTNSNAGIPGGEYVYGPTNAFGRSTYGLFGTATNATLTGVTFAGVAISNFADSVAALVGALAGNCAISNVTVESGTVAGFGGTAAGVAGFADFTDFLTAINNTNRADVAADNRLYGDPRYAAGVLCVAGPTDEPASLGTVVATNNANYGSISNVIYDADLCGGNIAQVLAGTTLGAHFGEVHLTNNLAAGAVNPYFVRSPDNAIVPTNFPAVNLAPSFWGYGDDGTFYTSLDANEPGAIAVDPKWNTARMLSRYFPNGTLNAVGLVNDAITAMKSDPEGVVKFSESLETWGPVKLDRDLTLDLGGQTVFTIYINNTIEISEGVTATVKNGTIVVGTESEPFGGDTTHLTQENLTIQRVDADFLERTVLMVDDEFTYLFDLLDGSLGAVGKTLQLFEGALVSIDDASGSLCISGVPFVKLAKTFAFSPVKDDDGSTLYYRVVLSDDESAVPTTTATIGETTVAIDVGNTFKGVTYTIQTRTSLATTEWSNVGESVSVTENGQAVHLEAPKAGSTGFYRVLATPTAE